MSQELAVSLPSRILLGPSLAAIRFWWLVTLVVLYMMVREVRSHWEGLEGRHDTT